MTRALRRALLALAILLTSAAVPALQTTPAAALDTAPVSIVGTYHRLAKDVFDSHGDITHTYSDVLRVPGKAYPLRLSAGHGLASGDKVRVAAPAGYTTGALSPTSVTRLAPASTIGSAGTSAVLVILAYWSTRDTMTQAKATAQIFGDDDKWFREASYGRAGLAGVVTPWLRIPRPHDGQCYNHAEQLRYDAEQKARDLGSKYDPSNFQRTMIYFPRCGGYDTQNVAGWAYEPGNIVWLNGVMDRRTTIHELGHSYGLGHARSYACKSATGTPVTLSGSCRSSEYGDPYDAMGRTSYVAHFSGYRKDKLGWLGSRKRVLKTSSSTFTLPPFERPSTLPVVVVANSARVVTRSYWLEYRRPTGMDARLPAGATGGVLVHLQDTARPGWLLDGTPRDKSMSTAVLEPGTSWTAPDYVKITVGAISSTGIRVTVSGARPAPVAPSAPRVTAKASDGRVDVSWTPPASDGGAPILAYRLLLTSPAGNRGPYVLLGSERSVPMNGLENNVTYTASLRATNSAGTGPAGTASATPKSLGPTVSLSSPVAGATVKGLTRFVAKATPHPVTLAPVQCVEFIVDGVARTGTCSGDGNDLWSAAWDTTELPNGDHDVQVAASDAYGRYNTTAAYRVRFANALPEVAITSPKAGASINAETVTLTAAASVPLDPSVAITQVYYYDVTDNWERYLGGSGTAPFTLAWDVSRFTGTRRVVAVAAASNGRSVRSAPVELTVVHPPPTVAITSPAASTVSGTSVPVTATATSTATGQSVVRVAFFANGKLIGEDITAPYGVTWDTRAVIGSQELTATAYETSGRTGRSAGVGVTVDNPVPVMRLTAPAYGVGVTPAALVFTGTATAPVTGAAAPTHVTVTVGGVAREATVGADGAWSLPWHDLAYGFHSAVVTAHTPGGFTSPPYTQHLTVVRPTPVVTVAAPLPDTVVRIGASTEFVVAAAPGATDPDTITRVCVKVQYAEACATAPAADGKYHIVWWSSPASNYPDRTNSVVIVTMSDGFAHSMWGPVVKLALPPAVPHISEVRPADGSLTVYFRPSYEYQPVPITSYDVTVGDLTKTVTSTAAVTFTGLTNLLSYDVSVRATNEIGTSAAANTTAAPGIATAFVSWSYPYQVSYDGILEMRAVLRQQYTGAVLAGRTVSLERCAAGTCTAEATGTTAADGSVALAVTARTSGYFRLRYAGDGVAELPATGPAENGHYVAVVPRVELSVSASEVPYGEAVRLTLAVAPGTANTRSILYRDYYYWDYSNIAPTTTEPTAAHWDLVLPVGTYSYRVELYAYDAGRYVQSNVVTFRVVERDS
ncbi:MAG TPA: Ig-like domain-containing protein [Frankiaceae bacterium]|nr:Ig-like domain-containing protein [Frankiaceae bacterium]